MMNKLQIAIGEAYRAHLGQLDKAGDPFIGHPLRVMAGLAADGAPENMVIAAALHDVLEDTPTTRGELAAKGIPDEALDLVEVLTRRSDEDYVTYIMRVAMDRGARRIKQWDIRDNMDPTRTHAISGSMYKRYAEALRLLQVVDARERAGDQVYEDEEGAGD
jgi:hypothetical protein